MGYKVDFKNVEQVGLESSPVAEDFAGLRANEARYFWNKFKHEFVTEPASEHPDVIAYMNEVLSERDIEIQAKPLEVSQFHIEENNTKYTYVLYEDGLAINVMYGIDPDGKRAVGFKLTDGMEVPAELADKFKFARQKSKLAGTIRGSFFVIKQEH